MLILLMHKCATRPQWVNPNFLVTARELIHTQHGNRAVAQFPQCISPICYNAPFCNRNVHMCAHFCYKICIVGHLPHALWNLWDGSVPHKAIFAKPELSSPKIGIVTSSMTLSTVEYTHAYSQLRSFFYFYVGGIMPNYNMMVSAL